MVASGEIISLILRDESLHGKYIGLLAQELYQEFTKEEQDKLKEEVFKLLDLLMDNEINYVKNIYEEVDNLKTKGIIDEVIKFMKYNANTALENLGYESKYPSSEVQPSDRRYRRLPIPS